MFKYPSPSIPNSLLAQTLLPQATPACYNTDLSAKPQTQVRGVRLAPSHTFSMHMAAGATELPSFGP